ncbi:MAG: EAL domain-containing protein [Desulfobacteraceae bacterium]|nr:EAL domain-containing protein [Desulfobacteraceae bacterium]
MDTLSKTLNQNVKIMKSRVTKYAIYGTLIAFIAIILATLLSCYVQYGEISLSNILETQKNNATLWILDVMPFVFAFWGQYTSSIMAYEASTMIMDQTADLKDLTVALEYKAAHEATHDAITALPNRLLLMDRLEQAIQSALRQKASLAFLILDIDGFKEINDTLGHYSGDRLLKQIVTRLQGMVRKSETLARVGADEFAILMQIESNNENILHIVKKIQKIFKNPFSIDSLSLEVQASTGIAIFPEHGKDMDTIVQRANIALSVAKQDSKKYTVYSKQLDKNSPHRLTMMGELRQAIENDELVLYFQPQINLHTRKVIGVEALVRWEHPEHGFMAPDEFIPMAERTGLIKPLSIWVLNHALSQAEKWHAQNIKLNIAINLSPVTYLDTELPNLIIGMLSLYNVPPNFITFEITESSMIKDPSLAMEIMNRLTENGIKISIDDFGTGYSSLAYLKNLPVSEVKIDKSFVTDMLKNDNDNVIVQSIIDLGHNLSLKVVAEGVEDKETAITLKKMGCDILQGYYISRPVCNDDLLIWLPKKRDKKIVK